MIEVKLLSTSEECEHILWELHRVQYASLLLKD